MDPRKIKTLRKMMTEAKEIQSIFEYFLDHFGEDDAFLALGKVQRHPDPTLKSLLALVGQQLLKTDVVRLDMQLVSVEPHHLIHGFVATNGKPTGVLYFTDIQVGIAGFVDPAQKKPTIWSRFSAQMLPKDYLPSEN